MDADIIGPKLSIIFRGLIRRESFPECWRSTYITDIARGAPSPDWGSYRPILITPILSKVYEKLVSHKLASFCEKYVFFVCCSVCLQERSGLH